MKRDLICLKISSGLGGGKKIPKIERKKKKKENPFSLVWKKEKNLTEFPTWVNGVLKTLDGGGSGGGGGGADSGRHNP